MSTNKYEVISINRQSYMAELSKLLGFMSAWDRRDALIKYDALFDEAADEAELIASLGSPTKLAIGLALNYVPSAPPSVKIEETREPDGSVGEFAADGQGEAPAEAKTEDIPEAPAGAEASEEARSEEIAEDLPAPLPAAEEEPAPIEEEEPLPPAPKRKVRVFGLVAAILFGLIIGVPVALVLIAVGIPFIALGLALIAIVVWIAMSTIGMLTMFSDVLIIVGGGLVLCALGLLVAWFGLWLSFELGYLWIGGVVLRLGRALSYKKEVASE